MIVSWCSGRAARGPSDPPVVLDPREWQRRGPCSGSSRVADQAEGAELLFLAGAVGLVEIAPPAVEEITGQRVARFLAVELREDPPAVRFAGHVRAIG